MITFLIVGSVVMAQVSSDTISKTTYTDYTPFNPKTGDVEGLFPIPSRDTARVYYWIVKYENDIIVNAKRKTDCFIEWNKNDTYKETFQYHNAWIRNKYPNTN